MLLGIKTHLKLKNLLKAQARLSRPDSMIATHRTGTRKLA